MPTVRCKIVAAAAAIGVIIFILGGILALKPDNNIIFDGSLFPDLLIIPAVGIAMSILYLLIAYRTINFRNWGNSGF